MKQADFAYSAGGAEALACIAGVYGADPASAAALRSDAEAAGYGVVDYDLLAELDDQGAGPLPGDVLVVDCPDADGATISALIHLDLRAGAARHPLIVSTTMAALDTVFACLDRSPAQLLVEPDRGERVVALGRALTMIPRMAVREHDEADRAALLRLTEQVAEIARQIDRLSSGQPAAFRLGSPTDDFSAGGESERALIRPPRPPLPDPRLVRRIIRQRRLRSEYFGDLFADPAWDILLDLTAARAEHVRVSVTSLCIASGVPPTTALRWIGQMTGAGLLEREEDDSDRRRVFIRLSDKAAEAMARYFAELGREARSPI